jgi:peroxiredoxin
MPLEVAGPTIGDTGPDFTLTEASGETIHLAAQHGRPVVLIFYRGGW